MTREVVLVLAAAALVNAGLLFEFIGLTVQGQHSISWYAHDFQPLRVVILFGILAMAGVWWWHSSLAPLR